MAKVTKTKGDTPEQAKMRESIRVAKFEVDSVIGQEWKEVLPRWFATMDYARRAANLYHETWLLWHVQNQSAMKIVEWLDRRKSEGIKQAGECPVKCFTPELSKLIYDTLKTRYASLQIDVVTGIMNVLQKTISTGKAASGSLPKWTSILLHNEGMPMFTRSFNVPFDKKNAKLIVNGAERFVELKLWRMPVEGKATNVAVVDRIKLRMTGKSAKGHLTRFDKIASGEWAFKGSEFSYDKNNKKWFVNLCHQCPSQVEALNPGKVAYLVAGRKCAFYLRFSGERSYWVLGRGNHIHEMREGIWKQRSKYQVNDKQSRRRGGHGRNAAMKWEGRLERSWRFFSRTQNHTLSRRVVDELVTRGIGTLVFVDPRTESYTNSRYVSGRYKNSTWSFFELGEMLKYKCQGRGVAFSKLTKCFSRGSVPSQTPGSLAEPESQVGPKVAKRGGKTK